MCQKKVIWMLTAALAGILMGVVIGCGGGSSGTGGQQYQGTILSRTAQPLTGVKVTIAQSGDNTLTDGNGYYSIITDAAGGAVTYVFEAPGIQIQFVLDGVPGNAAVVTVNFVLDEQEQSADPTLVDIDEDDSNSSASNDDDNDDENNSSSSGGNSSSVGSSSSEDDDGSSSGDDDSSDDDHGSSSVSSEDDDDGSSSSATSESEDDSSSESSESSSDSSESSDDDDDDDGESGGGGSGSGGSGSGSSSSDDD